MRLGKAVFAFVGLFLHLNPELAQTANILAVFPHRYTSGFQVVTSLVRALAKRGHNVTMISPMSMSPDIEGVRHIRVPMLNKQMQDILDSPVFQDSFRDKWREGVMAGAMLFNISHAILSDRGVKKMMMDKTERFDMIIMEASHLDAIYGLAEYYNATLVGLSCVRLNWFVDDLAGNPSPSIYEPISPMGFATEYSFVNRFWNWMHITEEKLLVRLVVQPPQLRVFTKYFGYPPEKMKELRSRFAIILVNNHFTMGRVRSNVPNIIEVGGIHLSEPAEPCDKELQRYLDEAEDGVVYFSMGLEILVKFLPQNMQQSLIECFAKLKQRVVWNSDLCSMPNKTDNVYLIHGAPQRAILAHPNVRLFITHGGLLSVIEAIHSGVPMLGLPLLFDQFGNMRRVQMAGIAEVLDVNSLTSESLTSTIEELLENPKYAIRAKEMSRSFMDRPMSPLDTAVWWLEYALRHPDVSHIRLDEEEIPFMWYYQLDCLMSFGLRFGLIAVAVILLGYKLLQKYRISQDMGRRE
ncbi:hypothetical protein KR009_009265 [Drosophila setifemur]|nr:hypothetical protein KR009_009265 [Drosophila setifemur]